MKKQLQTITDVFLLETDQNIYGTNRVHVFEKKTLLAKLASISLLCCGLFFTSACFKSVQNVPLALSWLIYLFFFFLLYHLCKKVIPWMRVHQIRISVILLLGLLLRLGWVFLTSNEQVSDFRNYQNMALLMQERGLWFHESLPMGTSVITFVSYSILGVHRWSGLLPMVLCSSAIIYLVYVFSSRHFDKKTASLAALLTCLSPDFIIYSNLINSDLYFCFFLLLSFILINHPFKNPLWNFVLSAASVALAQYIRSNASIFIPFILASFFLENTRTWKLFWLKGTVFFVSVYLVILLPQIYNNYQQHRIFSVNSSGYFGWSLMLSANPQYNGLRNTADVNYLDSIYSKEAPKVVHDTSKVKFQLAMGIGLSRISEDPARFIKNCLVKPALLWSNNANYSWSVEEKHLQKILQIVGFVYHKSVLLFSAVLLLLLYLRNKTFSAALLIMSLCICMMTFSHFFLEIQARYHLILMPFLYIFAAVFLMRWERGRRQTMNSQ